MMKYILPALALLASTSAFADAKVGEAAPDFSAKAVSGKTVKLSDYKGKIVVLEWTNPGCPFVKKFYNSDAMQQQQAMDTARGVVWLSINSSAKGNEGNLDAAAAKLYMTDKKAKPTQYLLDADGTVGHLYGAKTTPHMFVIAKDGTLAYAGAIDSKASVNPDDIKDSTNYVDAAIDALIDGKKPTVTSTQAYGCNVKY